MNKAEERAAILDHRSWPMWPKLPMKKYDVVRAGHMPQTGFILATDVMEGKFEVYVGNVFADYTREEFYSLKTETFETVDDMMLAGWVGD